MGNSGGMSSQEYLRLLRSRWILIVVLTLLGAATGAGYALLAPPIYTSSTKVFVSTTAASSLTDLSQGNTFTQNIVRSYAQVATAPIVLNKVRSELNLAATEEELANQVTANAPTDTTIVEITVTDRSSRRAADIANQIGLQLRQVVADLLPPSQNSDAAVRLTTIAAAQPAVSPSEPKFTLDLAIGVLVGVVIALAVIFILRLLDTKVRHPEDLAMSVDSPLLAEIVFDPRAKSAPVMLEESPSGVRAEAFRKLRTNLQFTNAGRLRSTYLITSSIAGEGKTTTLVNLAVALADAGKSVLVIDADLRRPMVAEYLGLEASVGLTTLLSEDTALEDVIQSWRDRGVDVIPSGEVPPNPSELLQTGRMRALLKTVAERYDVVFIDAPPLLPVSDGLILSEYADGTIVVAGAGRVSRTQVRTAENALIGAGAHISGVVLTMSKAIRGGGYYYPGEYSSYTGPRTIENDGLGA